jgi:hypothetical protein
MTPEAGHNTRKRGSVLKTTTWGTLIGASFMLAVLGLAAHFTSSDFIKLRPAPHPSTAVATANTVEQEGAGTVGLDASVRPAAVPNARPAGVLPAPAAIASRNEFSQQPFPAVAAPTTGGSTEPQPQAGPVTNGAEDQQALIAAKIAPDLTCIDPSKLVDVIVQFKGSPSAADLDNAAAQSKADLSVIGAKLVTVLVTT